MSDENGNWGEWSRHVLSELKRLNAANDTTSSQLAEIKADLQSHIHEIKIDLREHMRRTAIAEEGLALARQQHKDLQTQIDPLTDQAKFQRNLLKLVLAAASFGASCISILKFFGKI